MNVLCKTTNRIRVVKLCSPQRGQCSGGAGGSKEGSSELIARGVFRIVKLIAIRVLPKKIALIA
jgi:hypothetical protein